MSSQETLVLQALRLAEDGFPVFPCKGDKTPACRQCFHHATTDPDKIRQLFARADAELIGLPTGKASGLLVIDIDNKGAEGSLQDRSSILRDEGLWNALLQVVDAALPIEIGSRYLRHNVRPFVRPR